MDRDGEVYLNRIYRAYVSEGQRSNLPSILNDIWTCSKAFCPSSENNSVMTSFFVIDANVKGVMNFWADSLIATFTLAPSLVKNLIIWLYRVMVKI